LLAGALGSALGVLHPLLSRVDSRLGGVDSRLRLLGLFLGTGDGGDDRDCAIDLVEGRDRRLGPAGPGE
jgi:hypothetical protein